jgi:Zn-dependent protease with chaperone function
MFGNAYAAGVGNVGQMFVWCQGTVSIQRTTRRANAPLRHSRARIAAKNKTAIQPFREHHLDDDHYIGLIRALEAQSENAPAAFRSRVFAISIAAYVALFAILMLSIVIIYYGFSWAQQRHSVRSTIYVGLFALTMLPVFWVVGKFFLMRLPPPTGRELTRAEAPKLFEVIGKMRKKLNGPPIHHVLIDREYNAAIMQLPRFGLFGGHTNYLMMGLPYLLGVSPKEMLATVAHEYGHLCGNHGKMGAWVYRQRITLGALYEQVQNGAENSWVHAGISAALRRFMPYYNAYTFVLSRQQEYEADRTASEIAGTTHNANGLIRDALLGRWIHRDFWPGVYRQADQHAKPGFMPFNSMRLAFAASYDEWATRERMAAAWKTESDLLDTHPCLRERVEAIGEKLQLPVKVETPAADVLLGATTKKLIDEFDGDWWNSQKKNWESRHQHVQRSKTALENFRKQPLESLQLHELQQFAFLTDEFDSSEKAKPLLEYLMAKPGGPFPKPAYFYGRILLNEGNDRGLEFLETAARHDRNMFDDAAYAGYGYLVEKRGESAADAWCKNLAA